MLPDTQTDLVHHLQKAKALDTRCLRAWSQKRGLPAVSDRQAQDVHQLIQCSVLQHGGSALGPWRVQPGVRVPSMVPRRSLRELDRDVAPLCESLPDWCTAQHICEACRSGVTIAGQRVHAPFTPGRYRQEGGRPFCCLPGMTMLADKLCEESLISLPVRC